MTNTLPRINNQKVKIILVSIFMLTNELIYPQEATGAIVQIRNNLWGMVDAISNLQPLTKSGIEAILETTLHERPDSINLSYGFYETFDIALDDDTKISKIDFRASHTKPNTGFAIVNIEGRCINLSEIQAKFGKLKITETPRGKSLDEAISFSAFPSWGRLSFAFRVRNPDCLASIIFDQKNQ